MMTPPLLRRFALFATLTLALPMSAPAQPTPANGVYVQRAEYPAARAGTVVAMRQGRAYHVALGARVTPTRAVLFAEDNANARFQLFVVFPRRGGCSEGVLVAGGAIARSEGYGSDDTGCSFSFFLTASEAAAAATVLGIPRQDRAPAGERVQGAFAPSQTSFTAGQPVEVVLTLTNPPDAPAVQRHQGGRQRGPRDNQFAFRITRDGQPVAPIEGYDFGGLAGAIPMAPGARVELRAPLERWGDVRTPGRYVVECRYEAEFSPDGVSWMDDAHRGAVWDRVFEGRVSFEVR